MCAVGPGDIASHRALVFAGEASFAFYLVHQLVIVNLRRLVGNTHVDLLICLLVSVAAAVAQHVLVERPCNRFLRGRPRSAALQPIAVDVAPAGVRA